MTTSDPRRNHPGHEPTDPPPRRTLGVRLNDSSQEPPPKLTRSVDAKSWVAIITAIGSVLAVVLKPVPPSPTGEEVAAAKVEISQLRKEAEGLRHALAEADVPAMRAELRGLKDQVTALQKSRDDTNALALVNQENTVMLAEAFARQNGGPPNASWPEPSLSRWFAPLKPPPEYRTDRVWRR